MNPIKLVCFDLDGTLIEDNSWYLFNTALGVTPAEDASLFNRYKGGELTYDAWITELVALYTLHGKARKEYIEEIFSGISIRPVFLEIIKTLKNDGYAIAIISGSFDMAVKQVAKRAGIEHAFGCASIVFDENDMLQDVVTHGDESSAKLALLTELAQSLGVPLSQCACIGDGENDIAMFEATGCGITFRGSPIESSAWRVVDSIDEIPAVIASA